MGCRVDGSWFRRRAPRQRREEQRADNVVEVADAVSQLVSMCGEVSADESIGYILPFMGTVHACGEQSTYV